MKILMILTSHDRLGESGDRTGFWLEEFAAPYYAFIDAGAEVVLASPRGGLYSKADDWQAHVATEGLLVTGQNPASSSAAAQALLELVRTGTGERLEVSGRSRDARLRANA